MAQPKLVRLKFLQMTGGAALTVAAFGATDAHGASTGETISLPASPLRGMVAIGVEVHPTKNLLMVELFIDDRLIGSDTTSPYAFAWDTRTNVDGTHVVKAEAVYRNRRHSAVLSVFVRNAVNIWPSNDVFPSDNLVI